MEEKDYDQIISERAGEVFAAMEGRVSADDMTRIRDAFELARRAHAPQKRKTGEPYILHPIAVALIVARELSLDTNPVIAAFLHDVVEDTDYTIDDIRERFGDDVAFLVSVVTKQKKEKYEYSLQLDNFKQMLNSIQYDIRAILVKLADRLHNMRTLSSMRPDKQMKIAGETDYFYAPLANRLGLYLVKTELENLSFRFRCPNEYEELVRLIEDDRRAQAERLDIFCSQIRETLKDRGIHARVYIEYRQPYSIWRKMHKFGDDFNHLKYRHFTEIVFTTPEGISEKNMALRIYSILTDRFKEKPGGITNYIDSPKENGYQSFHVKLLADFGRWQEVHISSERMVRDSQLGCTAERTEDNIRRWIEKFRAILRDIAHQGSEGTNFLENVATTFYNDDIMTFTTKGKPVVLPQKATVLDFAFEVDPSMARHAKYARLNGFLASVKGRLHRGDVVEVFTEPECHPQPDWLDTVTTYKAKKAIEEYISSLPVDRYRRCPVCSPIPGEEVIGYRDDDGQTTIHKRDCPEVILMATQHGENIVSVDYQPSEILYPVEITVTAVDRYHLFIDIVDCISNNLNLSLDNFNTSTVDSIVTCTISLKVHSDCEVQSIMSHISAIDGVDTVRRSR